MSVHFISGKPGGGKSYYATSITWEILAETNKVIVTNLPLNVPEICAQLHFKFGQTFNAAERIRLLTPEETGQFWLYYGPGNDLDPKKRLKIDKPIVWDEKRQEWVPGKSQYHLDYGSRFETPVSVCYQIDEAHEFFNARQWADLGTDALHYLSQHRKLGDEVYFITQHVRNVDTQLRRVAQDFTYCRNHKKEKLPLLGGLFRSIPFVNRSTYPEEFTGQPGQIAQETKMFRISPSTIGACYDTAAGVGVRGAGADKDVKQKGLSPAWLLAVLICGALAIWYVPNAIAKNTLNVRPQVDKKAAGSSTNRVQGVSGSQSQSHTPQNTPVPVLSESPVYVSGVAALPGGRMIVYLTDGRSFSGNDPDLELILYDAFQRPSGARIAGKVYKMGTRFELDRLQKGPSEKIKSGSQM